MTQTFNTNLENSENNVFGFELEVEKEEKALLLLGAVIKYVLD